MMDDDRTSAEDRQATRVDARLRRGLEPGPEAVARVVRRSLRAGDSARPRRLPAVAATVVATIALAAAILHFLPWESGREADARTGHPAQTVEILTITNESGELEVLYPAEDSTGGAGRSEGKSNEEREVTIFNSDGIVAAIVPDPISHHFILGGEP